MASQAHRAPRIFTGDAFAATAADNENLELLEGCPLTPAEVLQWVRREKERLSRNLAADARLWACPEHQRTWNATLGIEQVTLRQCFGIIDGR